MKSKHKDLLNDLSDMGYSPAYAARRSVLRNAETLIVAQEQQIEALHAQLAGFRKVGCVRESDLIDWQTRGDDDRLWLEQLPEAFGDRKTLYVKD